MIRVKEAEIDDLNQIAEFQLLMAKETEELALDPSTVKRGVEAVIRNAAKGRYFVAQSDGQTVGVLLTIPEWSDWRNGTILWVHSVYVVPDYRKGGVFAALYGHVKNIILSSPDYRGIRLYVDKRNTRAARVYEKMGMSNEHYDMFEWLK